MKKVLLAIATAFTLVMATLSLPAFATNKGTDEKGDSSSACSVRWEASSVLDRDLTNDDPAYPGLMVDVNGNPVDYSNGGYLKEVRPDVANGPGLLEVNHWYNGDGSVGSWRIPVATNHTIKDAVATVTLQPGATGVTFDAVSSNGAMSRWGAPYNHYGWKSQATLRGNADNVYTVDLGRLEVGTGTVFQLNFDSTGVDVNQPVVASVTLTGTYLPGTSYSTSYSDVSCPGPQLPDPPAPDQDGCTTELSGVSVFPAGESDITIRHRYDNGVAVQDATQANGETNADGWGAYPDRSLRLYAATNHGLTDVDIVFRASDSFTFTGTTLQVITGQARGMGQVYGNGFTVAVPQYGTPVISADGKKVTMHIDYMPAKSAVAIGGITAKGDGTDAAFVITSSLKGTNPNCGPIPTIPAVTHQDCVAQLQGRSVFPIDDTGVTVREKYEDGEQFADVKQHSGEINIDGWMAGGTRYLRLYAASTKDLKDVDLTFTAAQGFTFTNPADVITGGQNGMGALPGNGFTGKAYGIGTPTTSTDGRAVTLHVDYMPAMSGIAFGAIAVPDGSGKDLVVLSSMTGDVLGCVVGPTMTVTPTATSTVTVTPTVTGPPTTMTPTETAPAVTETPTTTAPPVTVTATQTVTATETATQTVTATVTATQTVTATETVTTTATHTAPPVTVTPTETGPAVTVAPTETGCPDHCGRPTATVTVPEQPHGPAQPNLPRTGGESTVPWLMFGMAAMAGVGISMLRRK